MPVEIPKERSGGYLQVSRQTTVQEQAVSREGSVSLRTPSKAAVLVTLTPNTLSFIVNSTDGKADLSLFHRVH